MRRREFLKYSAATALAGSVGYSAAGADLPPVKVAVIGAKTGPLAPGAAVTHFPPSRLPHDEFRINRGSWAAARSR